MKITVETPVKAKLNKVWDAWNDPVDIKQWNTAQDDWHTTRSSVDLREGGKFLSRMEAKDGSARRRHQDGDHKDAWRPNIFIKPSRPARS
jgi:uncharacterized protein YndB with AHSA1/START domain